jgi:hypothetical protein
MSTDPPDISNGVGDNVGGATGIRSGRLTDLAPSCADPGEDLVLSYLPWPAWRVLLANSAAPLQAQNALKAIVAWKDAGRLRRAHGLPLWPGEDQPAAGVVRPAFRSARQAHPEQEEIQDRVHHLEQLAFESMSESLELTRAALDAAATPQRPDRRLATLRAAADQAPDKRKQLLAQNQVPASAVPRFSAKHLERMRQQTGTTIEDSVRWAVHLARHFRDSFTALSRDSVTDLRTGWWEAQDQGRTAGCVGWAVADLLHLQKRSPMDVPSARYLWQGAKELDGEARPTTFVAGAGTSLRAALQLVKQVGCALESELPSDSMELFRGSLEEFYDNRVSQRRVAAVVDLGMDKKLWLPWMALGRPMVCTILMNTELATITGRDCRLGRFDLTETGLFHHAVVIAGWRLAPETFSEPSPLYDLVDGASKADTKSLDDPKSYFPVEYLVRNSFGSDWGDRGYAWVPHRFMRLMCREAYGLLLSPRELMEPGRAPEEPTWTTTAREELAAEAVETAVP